MEDLTEKDNNTKNSILFVSDQSMALVGGSNESLKIVMNGIKSMYNVSLITPGKYIYDAQHITNYSFSKYDSMKQMIVHPISFLLYYLKMIKVINKEKYSLIHTQDQVGFWAISFFKRLHFINRNICLIHTERGLREKYGNLVNRIFDFSLKYADVIVTTTNYNCDAWKKVIKDKYPNNNIDCIVIENTAGSLFEIYEEAKRKPSQKLKIGFAGRYCDWKGWDLAEEICNKLVESPNIEVSMVIGCSDKQDYYESEKIFSRLREVLKGRFKGSINYSREQMNDFYYAIDVFLLTSKPHAESFGRVLVEAMSRKVVVLGTNCGGATEVIGNQSHIFEDSEGFVNKLKEFDGDRKLLLCKQEEALQQFREHYSLENNIRKHLRLYESCFISLL